MPQMQAEMDVAPAPAKCDRRSLRSQRALRDALAPELAEKGDLSQLSVAGLTERAGLTRRTFYSHYQDIPDFVEKVEAELLVDIGRLIRGIAATTLPQVYENINALEPCPGSVELLQYFLDNRDLIGALMGPGGDPAFISKITALARDEVADRMKTGIVSAALGTFFDYYLSYVIAAEVGVVQHWFETGLRESPEVLARLMTVIAFVRPGDLYGQPIDINVPAYGMLLSKIKPASRESEEM